MHNTEVSLANSSESINGIEGKNSTNRSIILMINLDFLTNEKPGRVFAGFFTKDYSGNTRSDREGQLSEQKNAALLHNQYCWLLKC